MKKVIIIGGGVAGLGAAYKVKRAADEGHDVGFTLIEKDSRLGGKIATETVADEWDGAEGAEFIIDGGPDCFLTSKPAVHRIAKAAGIFDDELPSDESRKKTLILSRGKLYEMPDGVMMFAPTKFMPFATTGLFSWPGKIRMGWDLFVPKKKLVEGQLNDETLENFIVRRMGRECLNRLAEPLVGGVHASDPKMMSLAATFPNLLEMEQKYGDGAEVRQHAQGFPRHPQDGRGDEEEVPAQARRQAQDVLHVVCGRHAGARRRYGRCGRSRLDSNRRRSHCDRA